MAERHRFAQQDNRFDFVGFVLVATFLGALEIALDRGLEDDWFASSFIVAVTTVCALAFVLMIPWEISIATRSSICGSSRRASSEPAFW